MGEFRFERWSGVPPIEARKPGTFYLVADPGNTEAFQLHVTGKNVNTMKRLLTLADVTALLSGVSGAGDPGDLTLIFDNQLV